MYKSLLHVIIRYSLALIVMNIPMAAQNEVAVLDENILTVQFSLSGLQMSLPLVNLNAPNGILRFEFDHFGTDLMDYNYTVVHCNSDWTPSDLLETEYINGYTEDRILNIESSFNTLAQYTHYQLYMPNNNLRWTKSGNYLLKVFDDNNDNQLVIVRRFCVVEPNWKLNAQFVRPVKVDKIDTHHEIDFTVTVAKDRVNNPQNDIKAFVLQNGRWDNMIGPIKPFITRGEDLVFDFQDKIVFPAGKEFRYFDIRSFDVRRERVRAINEKIDYYEVTVQRDESRFNRPIVYEQDADGGFIIENKNANQTLLQCDYAEVLIAISQNTPLEDEDVYVFGALSDWQLKKEFKMEYNSESKAYFCAPFLKQGYYNYQYLVVNRETKAIDLDGFEGNWHETGNIYTALVYFRPFGARFDRLVAASSIDYKRTK